jgi:protein gp37
MQKSDIQWTDQTWNPVTGCSKVSEGCRNCYAERTAEWLHRLGAYRNGFNVTLHPEKLSEPLKRKKGTLIFVNSMSDLFHEAVNDTFIRNAFAVMAQCPQHTFQILTKRPERMKEFFTNPNMGLEKYEWPLPNVWLGVSVESQDVADERLHPLFQTPAALRWVSAEPLLGPLDLRSWIRKGLGWIVAGGESGPNARLMEPEWVRSLRDQRQDSTCLFFFKQWGRWKPIRASDLQFDNTPNKLCENFQVSDLKNVFLDMGSRFKEKAAVLDGRSWLEMPRTTARTSDRH